VDEEPALRAIAKWQQRKTGACLRPYPGMHD
jgi:hypothetical protein